MKISHPWTITWDPDSVALVLASPTDLIEDSIQFPSRQAVQARKSVGAATTDFLPRKQWEETFSFHVYQAHASVAAALLFIPARKLAVRAITRADLQLLSDDGSGGTDEVRLTNAVLESVDPRPNFSKADPTTTVTSYTFRASNLIVPTP